MILKNSWGFLSLLVIVVLSSCGVYSFTGAAIEGKTINVHYIENNARNLVPTLSPTFTEKLRQRILSQSSLAQLNSDKTDYDLQGSITAYDVTVASINSETSAKNRLTISVQIDFENRINEKGNFSQVFTRFADFAADRTVQSVETQLINEISDQLADDIFNRAFVNW
ncbi:MAG: hypothetical protein JNJ58_04715 [Chitinophagaceae bacterium]|nr:hypothetical protein [Chitinophagaceae bacterium]